MAKHRRIPRDLHDDLEQIKTALTLTAKDVRGRAVAAFLTSLDNLKETKTNVEHSLVKFVDKKPFKALGIAVLSGIILGFSMKKKKRYYNHRN